MHICQSAEASSLERQKVQTQKHLDRSRIHSSFVRPDKITLEFRDSAYRCDDYEYSAHSSLGQVRGAPGSLIRHCHRLFLIHIHCFSVQTRGQHATSAHRGGVQLAMRGLNLGAQRGEKRPRLCMRAGFPREMLISAVADVVARGVIVGVERTELES
eukprot:3934428-Prymnesium_polylepis.2